MALKLPMPGKQAPELELSMEEAPMEEAPVEGPVPEEVLASLSDDMLIEELKKRGFDIEEAEAEMA